MRSFLFILFTLLATPVFAQIIVIDKLPLRPLPVFVQTLSDEDYALWAGWQNNQAALRAENNAFYSFERPYIETMRTVVKTASGSRSTANASGTTTQNSSSRGYSKNGHSRRDNNSTTTRNMSSNRSNRAWGTTTAETIPQRYINSAYVPTGAVTVYNPFVKLEKGAGIPDWNNLFVPCEEGTMTLTEALNSCRGPMSTEKLYRTLFEGWF